MAGDDRELSDVDRLEKLDRQFFVQAVIRISTLAIGLPSPR
jgi:hypothetical protein